jgi:hypothetical protein
MQQQNLIGADGSGSAGGNAADSNCKVINFSWPTNELVGDAYFGDMIRLADKSSTLLAGVMSTLQEMCPATPVYLGSHSLGARVLLGALKSLAASGASRVPLAVMTIAAVSKRVLNAGAEFDVSTLAVDKIIVAHSELDLVLNGAYNGADVLLLPIMDWITGGLIVDPLGLDGYQGNSAKVTNMDMKGNFGFDHGGVYRTARPEGDTNFKEFWLPLSNQLAVAAETCAASPGKSR